jgi:hypothetical protein
VNNSGETMALQDARARAERLFKQQERDREGKTAMAQYQADAIAVRKKTARLKALRLAKEAEAQGAPLRRPSK